MNQRIKELAEQATQEFSPAFEIDKWQEKFALLLVNECYNRAEGQYHHSGDEWDNAVMAVMDSIEELFRS